MDCKKCRESSIHHFLLVSIVTLLTHALCHVSRLLSFSFFDLPNIMAMQAVCSIRVFLICSNEYWLIPRASVWRKLGPLMDLLPGTIRSGAATGFCCNNDDKFTSLSCLAALAYIKKLLCNINKWREQSVLCTAQTRPQSIYRGLCGVRRALCLIWTCL